MTSFTIPISILLNYGVEISTRRKIVNKKILKRIDIRKKRKGRWGCQGGTEREAKSKKRENRVFLTSGKEALSPSSYLKQTDKQTNKKPESGKEGQFFVSSGICGFARDLKIEEEKEEVSDREI
ncbi:hypothetical protein SCA6_007327 [Theobroma cacao]